MKQVEHPLSKYIQSIKVQLDRIPDDNNETYDSSLIQVMCLERFANSQGYRIEQGLFVSGDPAARVMTLDRMVVLYNNTMVFAGDKLKGTGYPEKLFLAGRNLRGKVVVKKHRLKFL